MAGERRGIAVADLITAVHQAPRRRSCFLEAPTGLRSRLGLVWRPVEGALRCRYHGVMPHRPLAILLLVAVLFQAFLAGLPSRALVICLGPAHGDGDSAGVEVGCTHGTGELWPEHEEQCPDECTDVVVQAGRLEPASPGEPVRVSVPISWVMAPMAIAAVPRPAALQTADPDPGDSFSARVLRTTRLLI